MLLAKDAFSDASIEDGVLNFLESQRLRFDILTRERHNYYEKKRKVPSLLSRSTLRHRLSCISCVPPFNFALHFVWELEGTNAKNGNIPSVPRDLFSINSQNEIFLRTFHTKKIRYKV